jgi:hypothetical protein
VAWGARGAISSLAIGAACGFLIGIGMHFFPGNNSYKQSFSAFGMGGALTILWCFFAFPGMGIGLAIRAIMRRHISN